MHEMDATVHGFCANSPEKSIWSQMPMFECMDKCLIFEFKSSLQNSNENVNIFMIKMHDM
jgi:hypothetical protein